MSLMRHQVFRQPIMPNSCVIGDIWSDTDTLTIKKCISVTPITFVSIEGSFNVRVVTATTTLVVGDDAVIFNLSNATTDAVANLPTASSCIGKEFKLIKKDSSNFKVTVDPFNVELINDMVMYELPAQWNYVVVKSDGVGWVIIGNN